jgi:hypothetical protein
VLGGGPGRLRWWGGDEWRGTSRTLKQDKLIPFSYADQIVPGSFEYSLNEIVEKHLDPRVFEPRYCNDETGRLAYGPKVLLKIPLG